MSRLTRRNFIKGVAYVTGAAVASGLPSMAWSKTLGTNDDVRVAVVGLGGDVGTCRGAEHIDVFRELEGVRVAALCDADRDSLDREVKKFTERNEKVATCVDVRKLLEDKEKEILEV
jgi:hypothetical protein